MNIKEITKSVSEHLEEFDIYYKEQLETKVSLLNLILKYVNKKKGKRIRPLLVFLSAEISGGINRRTHIGATMVEFLHTATLIHDDVVDKAQERRGLASVNAEWNNKIAVLVGDFLLSQGLLQATDNDEFGFLKSTSRSVKRMSRGELMSIDQNRSFKNDESIYYEIISDKTASLMATCCEVGAISATGDTSVHETLSNFGENLGMAFQIRDDIFDYNSSSSLIGKPVGNDIKEKKLTLPLLYALDQIEQKEADSIIKMIKKGNLNKGEIKNIVKLTHEKGGINYAEKKAGEFVDKSLSYISDFPDSEAKDNLEKLSKFVVLRDS